MKLAILATNTKFTINNSVHVYQIVGQMHNGLKGQKFANV